MPRVPSLCTHARSGRAYVTDPATGEQIPMGRAGTPEAGANYQRWLIGHLAGRPAPPARTRGRHAPTVYCLVADYLEFVRGYYTKNGRPTSEANLCRYALAPLAELFGPLPADVLTPGRLKQLRDAYVAKGWARGYVNEQVGRVRRLYRWAVEHERVSVAVLQALGAVAPLRRGRTAAPEEREVQPVPLDVLHATLPHFRPHNRLLVQVHFALACRAGEVVQLRPCDLDRSAVPWVFTPASYKTEHLGLARRVYCGPQARELLLPVLERARPGDWLFPAKARGRMFGRARGQHRSVSGYRKFVADACRRHGLPHWCPLQIRHLAATLIRERYSLDAAQVILGHAHADVTQVYAARSEALARRVAEQGW